MLNCLIIFVAAAICIIVGAVLAIIIKGRQSRTICHLEISNLGNIRSRYDLRAQDPAGELVFQFTLGGTNLPQRQIVAATESIQPATAQGGPQPAAGGAAAPGAPASGPGVSALASGLANLLYSVGYLLPSAAGQPLIQAGSRLRQGQYAADSVGRARTDAEQLASAGQPPARQAIRAPASTLAPEPPAAETATGAPGAATGVWVQTPFIEPGQAVTIDVFIDPLRFHSQPVSYPFQIMSRSAEQPDAAWTKDEWTAQVNSLSMLSRNTPLLIVVAVVAVGLLLASAFCVNSTGLLR